MLKQRAIITIAVIMALQPVLGFPLDWKYIVIGVGGIMIVLLTIFDSCWRCGARWADARISPSLTYNDSDFRMNATIFWLTLPGLLNSQKYKLLVLLNGDCLGIGSHVILLRSRTPRSKRLRR